MRHLILTAILATALAVPASAATYPVSGRWGQSTGGDKGAIDCSGRRVIAFNGNTRTDSGGSVPAYQNRSVTDDGPSQYRIVDIFTNGQINSGQFSYTLRQIDADRIVLQMQDGTLTLQRCK